MKTCPHCGAENRAGAKFCAVCGKVLPAAGPASSSVVPLPVQNPPAPGPTVLQPSPLPTGQGPPVVSPAVAAWAPRRKRRWGEPLVAGRVSVIDPEREAKPPFDTGRALVILAVMLVVLGICVLSAIVTFTLFVVLLVLGVSSMCLLSALFPLLSLILGPLVYWLRGNQRLAMLDFQVEEGGVPVSVVLYRKEGSSGLRLGDQVRVFGHWRRSTRNIHAHRVEVYESGGRPADYVVLGVHPWPIWVGLLALGVVLAGYTYVFSGVYVAYLGR